MSSSEFVVLKRFAANGDADAFSEIARKHAPLVYGVCFRILGNKENAADAVQDTFLQLVRNADSITGSLSNWLHRVAKNRALELIRQESSRKEHEKTYAADSQKNLSLQENASWREISGCIDEELDKLDDLTREVLILHFLENQTMTSIAEKFDISQPTVSRRIESGIVSLRHNLKNRGVIVPAAILTALLTENIVKAAPASIMKELGKIALAGSGTSTSATISSGISAIKVIIAAVVVTSLIGLGLLILNANSSQETVLSDGDLQNISIIDKLKAIDNTYFHQHTLTIERTQDKDFFLGYDSIGFRETVTVTMDGDITAYSITRDYEKEPSYPENLPSNNYDINGNFISWRDTHRQGLISPKLNASRVRRVTKMLTPDNQVLIDDEGAPQIEFQDAMDDTTKNETYPLDYLAPILSTGRGYGSLLVRIKEIIEETPNEITFTAYGRFSRDHALWKITVDKQNGCLVRSAQYYGEGNPPIFSFSPKGTKWYGDFCIAETAAYWVSEPNNVVTVKIRKYESGPDRKLIANIHKIITEPSINTDVVDWRGDPNNPLMYRVKDSFFSDRGTLYKESYTPSLISKILPDMNDFHTNLKRADMIDKSILICFWDFEQRPSRSCIQEINKKAEKLKQENVEIIAIQSSKTDQNSFDNWIKEYNINIPMASIAIEEYSEIIRFNWGVKFLPWLILTDKNYVVTDEGFSITELDEKIKS